MNSTIPGEAVLVTPSGDHSLVFDSTDWDVPQTIGVLGVADDVADTGHTLRSVLDFCNGKVAEVRTAWSATLPAALA